MSSGLAVLGVLIARWARHAGTVTSRTDAGHWVGYTQSSDGPKWVSAIVAGRSVEGASRRKWESLRDAAVHQLLARRRAPAVELLWADLERANHDVWFDEELEGGQQWWNAILHEIQACAVFVFALTPTSIASRACRCELEYAVAMNRPLLPIMLRDTNVALAPEPIGTTQIVDYRNRPRRMPSRCS